MQAVSEYILCSTAGAAVQVNGCLAVMIECNNGCWMISVLNTYLVHVKHRTGQALLWLPLLDCHVFRA